MTPDEIDTAIAEFRGWTDIGIYPESGRLWGNRPGSEGESYRLNAVPQFHKCLNAMAEARKGLLIGTANQVIHATNAYTENLCRILKCMDTALFQFVNAGAAQQAEALLRTIGKYQEPEKLSTHCAV